MPQPPARTPPILAQHPGCRSGRIWSIQALEFGLTQGDQPVHIPVLGATGEKIRGVQIQDPTEAELSEVKRHAIQRLAGLRPGSSGNRSRCIQGDQ